MSFLKISDPTKRDQTVKEYLELKKNIRDNLLSERVGEQQLQTELTKFYRPITESQKATMKEITESQKATAREITEGLRPIREGIENLPKAMQPIGNEEEDEEEDEDGTIGEIAKKYLNIPHEIRDTTFGVRKKGVHHYIGNKHVIIKDDNIIVDGKEFIGTPGLWELLMLKYPSPEERYLPDDYDNYERLMIQTNVLHRENDPYNIYPKGSKGHKWTRLHSPIWKKHREEEVEKRQAEWRKKGYTGKGTVIMSSDPNALLERLDLLLASQKAGHTGVGNELVSICDKLKRQGVLDTEAYKKLNSIIKNDSI